MKPKDDFLILGFTGPFCSGCTTAAKFFENKLNEEKNNLILKKNEVDSLIANYYTNPPKEIIVSNDITKKKYIIRLLRERQIINALCKIQDHSFYYISMTDMMNSIMVIRFLNKSPAKTKLKEKYLKLIMFLESWCLENSLNKRDVNIIRKAIDKRDMKKAKEIFAYYDKIKSFRKDIHEAFKDCQNDLFSIMQDIGNNLRKSNYPFYDDEPFTSSEYLSILSEEAAALLKFERNYKKENSLNDNRTYYIIECLRNPSEIEYLRRRFYEFYLFSIYSEENVRTNRAKENYGLSYEDCMKVDKRDQGSNYIKAQFKDRKSVV